MKQKTKKLVSSRDSSRKPENKKSKKGLIILLSIFILYTCFLWFPRTDFLYRGDDIPQILLEAKNTEKKPFITRPFKNSELFDYFAYSYGAIGSFIKVSEIKFFKGTGLVHTEQNHRFFIIIINLIITIGVVFILSRIIRFDWAVYSMFWLMSFPSEVSGQRNGISLSLFFLIAIITSGFLWLKTKNTKYLALMYLSLGLDIINNSLFFTNIFKLIFIVFFYSLSVIGLKLKVFKEFIVNLYQTLKSFWILIPIIACSAILVFTKHYASFLQSAYYKYNGMIIHNIIKSENSPNLGFYGHDIIANVPYQVGIPLFAISILTLLVFIIRKKLKPLHWVLLAIFISFLLPMLFYYDISWLGTPNKYLLFIVPGIVLTGLMYAQLVDKLSLSKTTLSGVEKLKYKIIFLIIPLVLTIPYTIGAIWNIKPFNKLYKNAPQRISFYGQWQENNGIKSIAYFARTNKIPIKNIYTPDNGGTELYYFGAYTQKIDYLAKTEPVNIIEKKQLVYLVELKDDKYADLRNKMIKKLELFDAVIVIDEKNNVVAKIWTNDQRYKSIVLDLKQIDQKYNHKYLVY